MPVHPIESRYGSDELRRVFSEENKVAKMLEVEAALVRALSEVFDFVPEEAADEVERVVEEITGDEEELRWFVERVKEIEAEIKHDVMALVKALSERCEVGGDYVHLGATSNDVIDTAHALVLREALSIIYRRLRHLAEVLAERAEKYADLPIVGRTHGQHAVPTTLGMKFAIWAREVVRHLKRLRECANRVLVGQLSGAVGTMAALGEKGPEVQRRVMDLLDLKPVTVSNQVIQRDRHAELIALLALIGSTLDKIGREIRNLQRTEIREVEEPFDPEKQVGSSTMPHKRNPIRSERVCSLARVLRSNVQVALENVPLEHERDLTNSASERVILPEQFLLLDEMLRLTIHNLEGLRVYEENIRKNLRLTKGLNMAEALMVELVKRGMGRQEAHELVRQLAMMAWEEGRDFAEVVKEEERIRELFEEEELENLLNPEKYLGVAPDLAREAAEKTRRDLEEIDRGMKEVLGISVG
ncbi:adenylosuccinate lyase [Methanopyrus sp.]